MKKRGFEIISAYAGCDIEIPKRKTIKSAGYDIAAAEDTWAKSHEVAMVATGLKAFMCDDEFLGIHMRSGLAVREKLSLINSQGIIDADYYNNVDNEGHILIALINHSSKDVFIKKGTRIAQAIFYKYMLSDDDQEAEKISREGGFGSTGR